MSDVTNESVDAVEATLNDVDRALERLRDGTYRTCELCGSTIDDDLIISDPFRTTCAAHPSLL